MLIARRRLSIDADTAEFLQAVLTARSIRVLPISPQVAALSQAAIVPEGDPADCLIAATTVDHGARLVTRDRRLRDARGIPTVW